MIMLHRVRIVRSGSGGCIYGMVEFVAFPGRYSQEDHTLPAGRTKAALAVCPNMGDNIMLFQEVCPKMGDNIMLFQEKGRCRTV